MRDLSYKIKNIKSIKVPKSATLVVTVAKGTTVEECDRIYDLLYQNIGCNISIVPAETVLNIREEK